MLEMPRSFPMITDGNLALNRFQLSEGVEGSEYYIQVIELEIFLTDLAHVWLEQIVSDNIGYLKGQK